MFILDLITPNRRSPGWQFILFSVMFLTFLGLTLEYYSEMKLGYVLGIVIGSLLVLATIYGILVRNRGGLIEDIVESELRSNSNEYLVLDHQLDQYSKLLSAPSGSYSTRDIEKEMGKIRGRMNELDREGRLYFGGGNANIARDDIKKEKEGRLKRLLDERDRVAREIGQQYDKDIVADTREERKLAVNREILRKLNKELNSTESLYDRVGVASMESANMKGKIKNLESKIQKLKKDVAANPELQDEIDSLEGQKRELVKLEKEVTDFSNPGKTKVVSLEAGEAYLRASERLRDVKRVTTEKGKEYELERQERREQEKILRDVVDKTSETDSDKIQKEVDEVSSILTKEQINRRLLKEFKKGSFMGSEYSSKRQDLLNRYGTSGVFQAMDDQQKKDFVNGKLDRTKLVDATKKLSSYQERLRGERVKFFEKNSTDRDQYMLVKESEKLLTDRFRELEGEYQDEIDRITKEIKSISGSSSDIQKVIDKRIGEVDDRLDKLERGELEELYKLGDTKTEIDRIQKVREGVERWKDIDDFKTKARTDLRDLPDFDKEIDKFLETLKDASTRFSNAAQLGAAQAAAAARAAMSGAINQDNNVLGPAARAAGARPLVMIGRDGINAGTPQQFRQAMNATIDALKAIRDNGANDQVRRAARDDLKNIVETARTQQVFTDDRGVKAKSKLLDKFIVDEGKDVEDKLTSLAKDAKDLGIRGVEGQLNEKIRDIKNAKGSKDASKLSEVIKSVQDLVPAPAAGGGAAAGGGGLIVTETDTMKQNVATGLKQFGDALSDPKLGYTAAAPGVAANLPPNKTVLERERDDFVKQQKADLKAKLKFEKKILEKAKGPDVPAVVPKIQQGQQTTVPGSDQYSQRKQELLTLDPKSFDQIVPSVNLDSLNFTQQELQDVFDEYGNPGALTTSGDKTIGGLKNIIPGNQAYVQLVNNVIARTQGNAEDAIKKLQRKKILEAQQKVLEDTKKELEDAPKGLEGERLAKQKSLLGVDEAGAIPIISF